MELKKEMLITSNKKKTPTHTFLLYIVLIKTISSGRNIKNKRKTTYTYNIQWRGSANTDCKLIINSNVEFFCSVRDYDSLHIHSKLTIKEKKCYNNKNLINKFFEYFILLLFLVISLFFHFFFSQYLQFLFSRKW